MPRRLVCVLALAAVLFLLADLVRGPLARADRPEPTVDPLLTLNQAFRQSYARARTATLDRLRPLVLAEGDRLVLLTGNGRQEVTVVPARYHELKAVAHVPLALYTLLLPTGQPAPLDDALRAELRSFRNLLAPARASLARRGFDAAQLARQYRLLDDSRRFLDETLAAKEVDANAVRAFSRRMAPLVLANASDAARLQIDAYRDQMAVWRRRLSDAEWGRLQVVVIGSAMPRRGHIAVQFFAHLLGEPGEGPRITYAESLWEDERALRLAGTRGLDTRIGRDFFGEDQRMHRDLLADAAAEYLKTMGKRND
jgi:hypothetical protein